MSVACAAHGAGDFVTTSGKLLISGFYGNRKECCGVRLRPRHLLSCLYNITSHVSSGREPVTGRRRCRSRRRRVTGRGGAPPDKQQQWCNDIFGKAYVRMGAQQHAADACGAGRRRSGRGCRYSATR
ncbi:unnamed protein product [Arctia plantaginis]|uniref:Uncharacterized protein n=1 Tax=Arctia plantaginis TaxID=874455 RepID=A0A8S0ZZN7_ARCPL|nr:unnamed protein product [Arctia plantaginis]